MFVCLDFYQYSFSLPSPSLPVGCCPLIFVIITYCPNKSVFVRFLSPLRSPKSPKVEIEILMTGTKIETCHQTMAYCDDLAVCSKLVLNWKMRIFVKYMFVFHDQYWKAEELKSNHFYINRNCFDWHKKSQSTNRDTHDWYQTCSMSSNKSRLWWSGSLFKTGLNFEEYE